MINLWRQWNGDRMKVDVERVGHTFGRAGKTSLRRWHLSRGLGMMWRSQLWKDLSLVVSVSDYLEVKPGRDVLKRKIEFLISRPVLPQPSGLHPWPCEALFCFLGDRAIIIDTCSSWTILRAKTAEQIVNKSQGLWRCRRDMKIHG